MTRQTRSARTALASLESLDIPARGRMLAAARLSGGIVDEQGGPMGRRVLRTPEERFEGLPGYEFEPHYVEVDGLRMHYVDEGPRDAAPVLLLHGEPSWSYLYRSMIPVLVEAGNRVVAPDMIGFGRSDKPARIDDYSYQRHVDWVASMILTLRLQDITLFGQDWGGMIGLRLVAEDEDRFARVVAANTGLVTGDQRMPDIWHAFKKHVAEAPDIHVGGLVASGCVTRLTPDIVAAYDAPFPDPSFKAGARAFPLLVPTTPDDPASEPNRAAWKVLSGFTKPFLTLFSDSDPITSGADQHFRATVPGCAGQPHATIAGAGHFLQEDRGEEVARAVAAFIQGA